MSQNLSYSQIQSIGEYLKDLAKNNNLGFLKKMSLDEQLMSHISKYCFRPHFIDQLKEKLASKPYSLIIDNATFSNQNYCALKVKYLDKEFNEEMNEEVTTIKNRIVSLATLKESSSGMTMKELRINYFQMKILKITFKD